MEMVTLGKTGITVNKNGFGALPIQRISIDDAVVLARRAYEAGMTFFDTARFYTDSEEKLGEAFDGMREKVCIATKTAAQNAEDFWKDLEVSLHNLRTDYIDIYQFHNLSARSRGMAQDCMKRCWRQKHRGKSAILELQTTGWQWQTRQLIPGCMRHYSFHSVILRQKKIWNL